MTADNIKRLTGIAVVVCDFGAAANIGATPEYYARQFPISKELAEFIDKSTHQYSTITLALVYDDNACPKCGGTLRPGKALVNGWSGSDDMGEVCTVSADPKLHKLIDCMKCEKCGWSVSIGADPRYLADPCYPEAKHPEWRKAVCFACARRAEGIPEQSQHPIAPALDAEGECVNFIRRGDERD
ncbi:MAG: hypothetical protein LBG66_03170 [Gallionellaceae bacterium]|jgi:hypothetical protein|nr:hypothetical protein [Gallionellaceae bacterium]